MNEDLLVMVYVDDSGNTVIKMDEPGVTSWCKWTVTWKVWYQGGHDMETRWNWKKMLKSGTEMEMVKPG